MNDAHTLSFKASDFPALTYAFDCDGTLQDHNDEPRREIIEVLKALAKAGHHIVVWSGGGKDYALSVSRRHGIDQLVGRFASKTESSTQGGDIRADVCFDDQPTRLARLDVRV